MQAHRQERVMSAMDGCFENSSRSDEHRNTRSPNEAAKVKYPHARQTLLDMQTKKPPGFDAFRSLLHAMQLEVDRLEAWSLASCAENAIEAELEDAKSQWVPDERSEVEQAGTSDEDNFSPRSSEEVSPPTGHGAVPSVLGALTQHRRKLQRKDADSEAISLSRPRCNSSSAKAQFSQIPSPSVWRPTTVTLCETKPALASPPQETKSEYRRWFDELDQEQVGFLTANQIYGFMCEVQGCTWLQGLSRTRDVMWVRDTLREFHRCYFGHFTERSLADTCNSVFSPPSEFEGIDAGMFVDLVIWDNIALLFKGELLHDVFDIRLALVKHSFDLQIWRSFGAKKVNSRVVQESFALRAMEPLMVFIIVTNAITIGVASDAAWSGWREVEIVFTSIFVFELCIKIFVLGIRTHFFGSDWAWSFFDAFIVAIACFDLVIAEVLHSSGQSFSDVTIIKLVRLARLTRILRVLRLLRLRIFKELLLMIKGLTAVIRTLFSAMVLIFFIVYMLAMLCRQTLGDQYLDIDENKSYLFSSLPLSMFTVFRCFTLECSSPEGKPILSYLTSMYGSAFALPYAVCFLFIYFGVFNLIMAIFVENVMEAAKQKRELNENAERTRVCYKLRELVLEFCGAAGRNRTLYSRRTTAVQTRSPHPKVLRCFPWRRQKTDSPFTDHNLDLQPHDSEGRVTFQMCAHITRNRFYEVIAYESVNDLFDDLGIYLGDKSELFDVLDADGSGLVDASELITGLLKLRSGGADRSDIVAALLSLRSIQRFMREMSSVQEEIFTSIQNITPPTPQNKQRNLSIHPPLLLEPRGSVWNL